MSALYLLHSAVIQFQLCLFNRFAEMATVIFVFELIQAHKHVKQQFEHCNSSDTNMYIIKMGGGVSL